MKKDKEEINRAITSLNAIRSQLILYSNLYEYISEEKYSTVVNALEDLLEEARND